MFMDDPPETHPAVNSFFVMPTDIFKGLHDEFAYICGFDAAEGILFRAGFRCGQNLIDHLDLDISDQELDRLWFRLWPELGLGRSEIISQDDKCITFKIFDSTEAQALGPCGRPSCDFSRGFICGIVSIIRNMNYMCTEDKCLANDDDYCIFTLKPDELMGGVL